MLEDEGIENITVIDVRQKCDFTDWMIIGEGKTTRHLGGAVDGLCKMASIYGFLVEKHNALIFTLKFLFYFIS